MSYKHTLAYTQIIPSGASSPKDQYISLFQQTLYEGFYNASDWWKIKEETSIGSRVYADIDVRIAHVINAETGLKLGDDWKTLYFSNIAYSAELGRLYTFDDNTWLTVNTEVVKNLTATCTIRRCNNTLRWIDEATGAYYEEPCAIEYLVKEPRNYATAGSPFMTPGGFLHIEMQLNPRSNLIKQNQRFLFGNPGHWSCYRVIGTGLNDFRNQATFDYSTARILTVDLVADFVNDELDDTTNGIADVNSNLYSISLDMSSIEGSALDTVQLTPTIIYNGNTVSRPVTWTSSDETKATVSNSGLVTMIANGSCTITASITGNPASATCSVQVTATPTVNVDVAIAPDKNYILEGVTQTYTVYLYENGAQQADAFTVTCAPNGVPAASYAFAQVDGNTFTIENKLRDVVSYLTVTCVSGLNTKTFDVYLRGKWI